MHGDAAGYVHAGAIGGRPYQGTPAGEEPVKAAPLTPEDAGSRGHAVTDELSAAVWEGD